MGHCAVLATGLRIGAARVAPGAVVPPDASSSCGERVAEPAPRGQLLAVRIVAAGRSTGIPGLPPSNDWTTWNAYEMRAAIEHLKHKLGR